jgi:limonene-1,2-epoxide hydrolase
MTSSSSPIPNFLRAFAGHCWSDLEPFLHEDVVYAVDGFDPVVGRRAVLAYWRRMFEAYGAVRMDAERQVRDGDIVIAAQRQLYLVEGRMPLSLRSMAVYELDDELIREWSDTFGSDGLDKDVAAVWRRLRAARW